MNQNNCTQDGINILGNAKGGRNVKILSFFDEDRALLSARSRDHPLPLSETCGSKDTLFSRIRTHFEGQVCPFYAPDRNTALALALAAATEKGSAYLCSETSYLATASDALIDRIAGTKLPGIPAPYGKLSPELIDDALETSPKSTYGRCRLVALSQPTEFGLVYTPGEIEKICLSAHEHDMLVLVDGSRLFFASAHLCRAFREQTRFAGVDIATFGGTKNGVKEGEVVLVFRSALAERLGEIRKNMQIDLSGAASFSSAFDQLLTDRLWRKRALHANEMAASLGRGLSGVPGIRLVCPVETNKVLVEVTPAIFQRLTKEYCLRTFRCPEITVRFVTNYTTSEEDIDRLMGTLR